MSFAYYGAYSCSFPAMNIPTNLPPSLQSHSMSLRVQSQLIATRDGDLLDSIRGLPPRRNMDSVDLLWAHAIAAESQTSMRYLQWASQLLAAECKETAQLFHILSEFSVSQALDYARQAASFDLPKLPADEYDWLFSDAPPPDSSPAVLRTITSSAVLQIAYKAEYRAFGFFDRITNETSDAPIRQLAADIVRDRRSHLKWLGDALGTDIGAKPLQAQSI